MAWIKDCQDDNCPSFGVDEVSPGTSIVRGADPSDPTREIDLHMGTDTLRALAGKLLAL